MPGVQDGRIGDTGQPFGEAVVKFLRIATGQIRTTAAVEKQRVARTQMIMHEDALAARRVARRVNEFDTDLAHRHHIAAVMTDQI